MKKRSRDYVTLRRRELVLAERVRQPLQAESLDPDPLTAFAITYGKLQPGEHAEIHISFLPISPWKQVSLRRNLARQAARAEHLAREDRGWLNPAKGVERRIERGGLFNKLDPSHSLWYAQVQAVTVGPTSSEATSLMALALAGFSPLRGLNWLKPSSFFLKTLPDSDLPLFRWWFDLRWRTGLFWPRKWNLVTAPELAGFLKPPTKRCSAPNVVRSNDQFLVPPEVPSYVPGQPGVLPIGEGMRTTGRDLVGVDLEETNTALVVGRSRFGKSTLAQDWALHLAVVEEASLYLIDPHHDAIGRLKEFFAGDRDLWSRVIEVDFSRQTGRPQPGFNLFDVKGLNEERVAARPTIITDAVSATMGWEVRSAPRVVNFITQAVHTLVALSKRLPSEYQPTIFQLGTLLTNERWRHQIRHYLPDPLLEFWEDRFPRYRDDSILPVTNLIDQLRQHQGMRTLLGQSRSTYDSAAVMNSGGIALITTGAERAGKLLANLLVYDVLKTALSRTNLDPIDRVPTYLLADELQRYDTGGEGYFADMLREAGKFALYTIGFVQDPNSLHADTRRALLQNRSHLLVTASSAEVSSLMARQWAEGPEEGDIQRLPKYHFVADTQTSGRKQRPFMITTVLPDDLRLWAHLHNPGEVATMEATIAEERCYMTPLQVEKHLGELDDKILDRLR